MSRYSAGPNNNQNKVNIDLAFTIALCLCLCISSPEPNVVLSSPFFPLLARSPSPREPTLPSFVFLSERKRSYRHRSRSRSFRRGIIQSTQIKMQIK